MSSFSDVLNPITLSTSLTIPASGHSRHQIPDGVKGTAATIALMRKLVTRAKRRGEVRELIGKILNPKDGARPCDSKDYYCYAQKAHEWVRDNILYVYDPNQVEFLESAAFLLKSRVGDCDSMDTLLASIFESMGLQTQFVTVMADASRPDEFSHVYTRVKIPGVGWVAADPIMPKKWFGWEPQAAGRRYWPASEDEAGQPVDTADSIQVSGQDSSMNSGVSGMRGLSGLGHGGHHHHHHGGGRGGWDSGWAPTLVLESPLTAYEVDSIDVVPAEHVDPQSEASDEATYHSYGMMGLRGLGDSAAPSTPVELEQILNGNVLRSIHALETSAAENINALEITKSSVDNLDSGFDKQAAQKAYNLAKAMVDEQKKNLQKLRQVYNEFMLAVQAYVGVMPNMPGMAGLASLSDTPAKTSLFGGLAQSINTLRETVASGASNVRQKVVDAYKWTGEAAKTTALVGAGTVGTVAAANILAVGAIAFLAYEFVWKPKLAGAAGRGRG